jgi:NAD(P)-dependent dehydrogenase (short-subunit alcohol dehydrogenase family)
LFAAVAFFPERYGESLVHLAVDALNKRTDDPVSLAVIRTAILDQLRSLQVDYIIQRIPMKRTGEPQEVAVVVHFLASRQAQRWRAAINISWA